MVKYKKDEMYLSIIDNILKNNEFKNLENIKHHNTNRMNHSIKVSYYSYKIAKYFKLDYEDAAIGGLLHDFYIEQISDLNKIKDKLLLFSTKHPKDAVNNAIMNFDLTEKEINIIKTHMFPMNYKIPKYAESWIVSVVDKILSFGEFYKKFSYKFAYLINLYIIFIINNIKY